MTVLHRLDKLAYKVANVVDIIILGKELPEDKVSYLFNGSAEIPSILIDPIKITKSNMRVELVKTGVYTESELYQ